MSPSGAISTDTTKSTVTALGTATPTTRPSNRFQLAKSGPGLAFICDTQRNPRHPHASPHAGHADPAVLQPAATRRGDRERRRVVLLRKMGDEVAQLADRARDEAPCTTLHAVPSVPTRAAWAVEYGPSSACRGRGWDAPSRAWQPESFSTTCCVMVPVSVTTLSRACPENTNCVRVVGERKRIDLEVVLNGWCDSMQCTSTAENQRAAIARAR